MEPTGRQTAKTAGEAPAAGSHNIKGIVNYELNEIRKGQIMQLVRKDAHVLHSYLHFIRTGSTDLKGLARAVKADAAAVPAATVEELDGYIRRLTGPPINPVTKVALAIADSYIVGNYLFNILDGASKFSQYGTEIGVLVFALANLGAIGLDKFITNHLPSRNKREWKKYEAYCLAAYGTKHPEYVTTDPKLVEGKRKELRVLNVIDDVSRGIMAGATALGVGKIFFDIATKTPSNLIGAVNLAFYGASPAEILGQFAFGSAVLMAITVGFMDTFNTAAFGIAKRVMRWNERRKASKAQATL